MGQRLRQARIAAKFKSARAAAMRFAWSASTYAAHENGQNQFDADTAVVYAKAFGIDASYLLFGDITNIGNNYIPVINMVGRQGDIWGRSDFADTSKTAMRIRVRSLETNEARGIVVAPGALWPQYRDWDLLVGWCADEDKEKFEGEAVVRTDNSHDLLRYMRPSGEAGRFDLETHVANPIRNVHVNWFMPIRYVIRFHHWISDWENSDIAKKLEAMDRRTRNVLT